jgi:hypothetical protein
MCPKIKKIKNGDSISLKRPQLDNLYPDNGGQIPSVDELLPKLNRCGSRSLVIFRGKYKISEGLKHQ